ncbi:hypothetical protein GGR20_001675 [Devosia subaequoris]|uniref:DUF2934 domain-containing protein n=1 Tax=Devosia subaequoris TaxID=395930 RepID=A0A7W6NBM0_9HYPH|nr:DUF2934 domain-containing protein [Devosia subaequoris]MBB4052033.1 hypothetical protein [Devosia subaequoris]MCP1210196.1 DUF2934 domain-containing protein [Devosia subaequoris]
MHKNSAIAEQLRQTAYFMWEQDGRPEGQAMAYWLRAKEALVRQFAYDRWLAGGAPPDQAELFWTEAERDLDEN